MDTYLDFEYSQLPQFFCKPYKYLLKKKRKFNVFARNAVTHGQSNKNIYRFHLEGGFFLKILPSKVNGIQIIFHITGKIFSNSLTIKSINLSKKGENIANKSNPTITPTHQSSSLLMVSKLGLFPPVCILSTTPTTKISGAPMWADL